MYRQVQQGLRGLDISTPDNSTPDISTPTIQPPDISTPYKSRLATPILQRMKFNLLFTRALNVESYCLHYAFKLFTHNL